MDKPFLRNLATMPEHYLDYIKATYKPVKTTSGENYDSPLTYITLEQSFLSSESEKELIEEKGFAPIGFLIALRIEMSRGIGYGIPLYNRALKKALNNIHIDTDIPMETLQDYYDTLIEYNLLIIIDDKQGNQVLTNYNQLYNWEYKEYTRWYNTEAKRKARAKQKDNAEEKIEEPDEIVEAPIPEEQEYYVPPEVMLEIRKEEQELFPIPSEDAAVVPVVTDLIELEFDDLEDDFLDDFM